MLSLTNSQFSFSLWSLFYIRLEFSFEVKSLKNNKFSLLFLVVPFYFLQMADNSAMFLE